LHPLLPPGWHQPHPLCLHPFCLPAGCNLTRCACSALRTHIAPSTPTRTHHITYDLRAHTRTLHIHSAHTHTHRDISPAHTHSAHTLCTHTHTLCTHAHTLCTHTHTLCTHTHTLSAHIHTLPAHTPSLPCPSPPHCGTPLPGCHTQMLGHAPDRECFEVRRQAPLPSTGVCNGMDVPEVFYVKVRAVLVACRVPTAPAWVQEVADRQVWATALSGQQRAALSSPPPLHSPLPLQSVFFLQGVMGAAVFAACWYELRGPVVVYPRPGFRFPHGPLLHYTWQHINTCTHWQAHLHTHTTARMHKCAQTHTNCYHSRAHIYRFLSRRSLLAGLFGTALLFYNYYEVGISVSSLLLCPHLPPLSCVGAPGCHCQRNTLREPPPFPCRICAQPCGLIPLQTTRVMWTTPLRESFAHPFLVVQMLAVMHSVRWVHFGAS